MEEEMEAAQPELAILGDIVKTVGTPGKKDREITQDGLLLNIQDSQTNQQMLETLRVIVGGRAEPPTKERFADIMNAATA